MYITVVCNQVMNSPLENDVMLVTEYMAGGAVMEYSKHFQKYIFSSSAARIMNGYGYSPGNPMDKKERIFREEKKTHDGDDIGNEGDKEGGGRSMTDAEAVSLTLDLLRGLHYLHSKGISHRCVLQFIV